MFKQKKLQQGFTLVELIVVMAIVAVFFGTIWNFMKPTARMYSQSNEYMNSESIVMNIQQTIDSELRYATNALVLTNYSGKPSELKIDSKLYNACLVIDQTTRRGDQHSDSYKIGANGTMYKYKYSSGGYGDKITLFPDDYLGTESYRFSVTNTSRVSAGRTFFSLQVGVSSFDNAYVNGEATTPENNPDTEVFEYSASVSMDNINALTSRNMEYHDCVTEAATIYNSYPSQVGEKGTYTYIFYKKVNLGAVDSETKLYNVYFRNADLTTIYETQTGVPEYNEAVPPSPAPVKAADATYIYVFKEWQPTVSGVDLSSLTGGTTEIYVNPVFTPLRKDSLKYDVKYWYSINDATPAHTITPQPYYGVDVTTAAYTSWGATQLPTPASCNLSGTDWTAEWALYNGSSSLNFLTDNLNYYVRFAKQHTVKFYASETDTTPMTTSTAYEYRVLKPGSVTDTILDTTDSIVPPSLPDGKTKWYIKSGSTLSLLKTQNVNKITDDMVLVAR
ncbi:MAG: prepilin-type N-terminal cleavage/methylation domain-containing protein [Oscillospiraceae bacterium]